MVKAVCIMIFFRAIKANPDKKLIFSKKLTPLIVV